MRARNNQKKLWKKNSSDRRSRKEARTAGEEGQNFSHSLSSMFRSVQGTQHPVDSVVSSVSTELTSGFFWLATGVIEVTEEMEEEKDEGPGRTSPGRTLRHTLGNVLK